MAEGDHVVVDQPLVSVETEKAVVEIPSPQAGHVAQLHARPGEHVKVGAPLLSFEEGPHAETGTVVGELAQPKSAPATPAGKAAGAEHVRAAPAVRARARGLGIDLARIIPSGPGGAITLADLEAASAPRPRRIRRSLERGATGDGFEHDARRTRGGAGLAPR